MPKISLEHLIHPRGRTWFAVVQVPRDLRPALGRSAFKRTTKERDVARAAVRAAPWVAEWKAQIEKARGQDAETFREAILAGTAGGRTISRAAQRVLLESHGLSLDPFQGSLETWRAALAQQGMKARQVDQYVADVTLYAPETEALEADAVSVVRTQGWADARVQAGDSPKTLQRRLAALRNYWGHLQDQGKVSRDKESPFAGKALRLPKKPKGAGGEPRREAFKPKDIATLHAAALEEAGKGKARGAQAQALGDLITLAAYTGGRIEELCTLTCADVDLDGLVMRLDSKTEAGRRDVPIVKALKPVVSRLMADTKDGFLIASTAANQYGELSQALGQKFGRLKTAKGFGPEYVFHSIRKTVATLLHDAGCPEAIAADVLGHEIQSMSYGVYSSGSSIKSRAEWMEKALHYPFEAA